MPSSDYVMCCSIGFLTRWPASMRSKFLSAKSRRSCSFASAICETGSDQGRCTRAPARQGAHFCRSLPHVPQAPPHHSAERPRICRVSPGAGRVSRTTTGRTALVLLSLLPRYMQYYIYYPNPPMCAVVFLFANTLDRIARWHLAWPDRKVHLLKRQARGPCHRVQRHAPLRQAFLVPTAIASHRGRVSKTSESRAHNRSLILRSALTDDSLNFRVPIQVACGGRAASRSEPPLRHVAAITTSATTKTATAPAAPATTWELDFNGQKWAPPLATVTGVPLNARLEPFLAFDCAPDATPMELAFEEMVCLSFAIFALPALTFPPLDLDFPAFAFASDPLPMAAGSAPTALLPFEVGRACPLDPFPRPTPPLLPTFPCAFAGVPGAFPNFAPLPLPFPPLPFPPLTCPVLAVGAGANVLAGLGGKVARKFLISCGRGGAAAAAVCKAQQLFQIYDPPYPITTPSTAIVLP